MVTATLLVLALAWHPLHASSTTVVVAPDGPSTVRLRVFAEDFPPGRNHQAIGRYIAERLQILKDMRPLPLTLVRERVEGDTQILEFAFVSNGCHGLTIWNGILTEEFPDQVNLVQVHCGGRTRQLVFSQGQPPRTL